MTSNLKQQGVEYAAQVLKEHGIRAELADLRGHGIAIILPGVSLFDIGYNTEGKINSSNKKEVSHVPN